MTQRYSDRGANILFQDSEGPFVHYLDYRKLLDASKEIFKFGEHDGPCTNEIESGPCILHLAASSQREAELRRVLYELGEDL